jgi:hypothetical protein
MRKPQCMIDGCTRHCFGAEPVCLPHFRALHLTLGDDDSPPPPGDAGPAVPVASAVAAGPQQPTISSKKEAWVEWAVARHGVARDTAESATKRQLIDLCGEAAIES